MAVNIPQDLAPMVFTQVQSGITVELLKTKEWSLYYGIDCEMISCRKGRNLFPYLKYRLSGLNANQLYYVYLELRRFGDKRYCYDSDQRKWLVSTDDPPLPRTNCLFQSEISPKMGRDLNGMEITFKHLKLVNTRQDQLGDEENARSPKDPKFFVHTRCFYMPYIMVADKLKEPSGSIDWDSVLLDCHFPITSFVTVTAYRNPDVTARKIERNPKAAAFKMKKQRNHGTAFIDDGDNRMMGNDPNRKLRSSDESMGTMDGGASNNGYAFAPQNQMFPFPPTYQQMQGSMLQQAPAPQYNFNNQNGFCNPPPLYYNSNAASLLPVQQNQQFNFATANMQNLQNSIATTNGQMAGNFYPQTTQNQPMFFGANQQLMPPPVEAAATGMATLNNVQPRNNNQIMNNNAGGYYNQQQAQPMMYANDQMNISPQNSMSTPFHAQMANTSGGGMNQNSPNNLAPQQNNLSNPYPAQVVNTPEGGMIQTSPNNLAPQQNNLPNPYPAQAVNTSEGGMIQTSPNNLALQQNNLSNPFPAQASNPEGQLAMNSSDTDEYCVQQQNNLANQQQASPAVLPSNQLSGAHQQTEMLTPYFDNPFADVDDALFDPVPDFSNIAGAQQNSESDQQQAQQPPFQQGWQEQQHFLPNQQQQLQANKSPQQQQHQQNDQYF